MDKERLAFRPKNVIRQDDETDGETINIYFDDLEYAINKAYQAVSALGYNIEETEIEINSQLYFFFALDKQFNWEEHMPMLELEFPDWDIIFEWF